MCPFCLSAAATWAIAATTSTGGFAALLVARRADPKDHHTEPTTEDSRR